MSTGKKLTSHAMDLTLRSGSAVRQPEGGILMDVAALRSKVTFQKNETSDR